MTTRLASLRAPAAHPTTHLRRPVVFAPLPQGHPILIRSALPAHTPALAALGAAGFTAAHRRALPPADLADLVAVAGQTPVGLVCLDPTQPPGILRQAGTVELCRFYLHANWTGRGSGSVLLEHALGEAAQRGFRACGLRVWQGNQRAVALYRRRGFETIATEQHNDTAAGDAPSIRLRRGRLSLSRRAT